MPRPPTGPARQLGWLEGALSEPRADWRIARGHYPIRPGREARSGTSELKDRLLPLLRRYSVHACLCDHERDLQRRRADGLEHARSGDGADRTSTGRPPITRVAAAIRGFALLRLTRDWLELRSYDQRARLPRDCYRYRSGVIPLRVAAAR